jgi:D-glycero-alpha-D-manno-heptose-7-phosphate kinase
MIIVKSPFRICLFGGSTDYVDFYEKHESFLIGTTIDKYTYQSMRIRPKILSNESVITYSQQQIVKTWDQINNPLIREILKHRDIKHHIEFNSYSDIPSRTGLGGSSSFAVGMLYLLNKLVNKHQSKKSLAQEAIFIERHLLKEPGGIQDQIWPAYGGLNTITIRRNGEFLVKPLSVTPEFEKELHNSMVLIYTNGQRDQDDIAKSHENKDKKTILDISYEAHSCFIKEDIKSIGKLMYDSWLEKRALSKIISNDNVDNIINYSMSAGAYGAKLLGSGGCGFVLVICNENTKTKLIETFKENVFDFEFDKTGVMQIYPTL